MPDGIDSDEEQPSKAAEEEEDDLPTLDAEEEEKLKNDESLKWDEDGDDEKDEEKEDGEKKDGDEEERGGGHVDLVPASHRPFMRGSTDNSEANLTFGSNGSAGRRPERRTRSGPHHLQLAAAEARDRPAAEVLDLLAAPAPPRAHGLSVSVMLAFCFLVSWGWKPGGLHGTSKKREPETRRRCWLVARIRTSYPIAF